MIAATELAKPEIALAVTGLGGVAPLTAPDVVASAANRHGAVTVESPRQELQLSGLQVLVAFLSAATLMGLFTWGLIQCWLFAH